MSVGIETSIDSDHAGSASPTLRKVERHEVVTPPLSSLNEERVSPRRLSALVFMHVGCVAVYWVGWSWTALLLALTLYLSRAFGLTAFYHRYFSHRSFKTTRWFQFFGGLLGAMAMQKGPLWWAAHHRSHHRETEQAGDVHSPHRHGFLWAHMGWFLTPKNNQLRVELVRDWLRYPELLWLDRLAPLVAGVLGLALYGLGEFIQHVAPRLETNGAQLLVWGFFVSTVALYHATYSVNSLAHLFGGRRFKTADESRNNGLVAILTLGEGWHNNHHRFPTSAKQGFVWWEIDPTYYALVVFAWLGLVWDLRGFPDHAASCREPAKFCDLQEG